jgi:hypothetical protein
MGRCSDSIDSKKSTKLLLDSLGFVSSVGFGAGTAEVEGGAAEVAGAEVRLGAAMFPASADGAKEKSQNARTDLIHRPRLACSPCTRVYSSQNLDLANTLPETRPKK